MGPAYQDISFPILNVVPWYQDIGFPILTIRLELIEKKVALRPPLDDSSSEESVQETVQHWLDSFLARGSLVAMLGGKVCYSACIHYC